MRRERETSFGYRCVLLAVIVLWAGVSAAPQQPSAVTEAANQSSDAESKSSSSEEDSHSSSKEENVSDDLIVLSSDRGPTKEPTKYDDLLRELEEKEQEEPFNPAPPLNISEFVALIPARQVVAIVNNYYRHDEEVQRAYDFIKTEIFELLQLVDVLALTNYLHGLGLDVMDLAQTVVQALKSASADNTPGSELDVAIVNEEQKGVHGLVDSVLGLLSAKQFSELYARKVKTDEHFARFNNNFFSTELKIILKNLYYSEPVRELFYKDKDDIYLPQIYEFIRHIRICPTDTPIRGEYRLKTCLQHEVPITPKSK
ncbi:uncharacterized protein LOC6579662 [Drosophila mojavensis]|nr:uncharacterized protein LOC6579662 [Drosophila mojavensis]